MEPQRHCQRFFFMILSIGRQTYLFYLTPSIKGHIMSGMNKLDREARARILHLLCEGQSIRAVTRLTGASKNTVTKLVVDAGHACTAYQDRVLRNLPTKRRKVPMPVEIGAAGAVG
jgi:hypothetical protein